MARSPAETFPPAHFIRDEMEARGWRESDLATRLGLDVGRAHEILQGETKITPDVAKLLSVAFGDDDADYWLNLEQAYERAQVRGASALAARV